MQRLQNHSEGLGRDRLDLDLQKNKRLLSISGIKSQTSTWFQQRNHPQAGTTEKKEGLIPIRSHRGPLT